MKPDRIGNLHIKERIRLRKSISDKQDLIKKLESEIDLDKKSYQDLNNDPEKYFTELAAIDRALEIMKQ
jgi:hypothetical protein